MPTAKPRITVTLKDSQHKLLSALSELQGQSMSSIVVELLESCEPVLERLAVILKSAKEAPKITKEELRKNLDSAEAALLPMAAEMMGQLDLLVNVAGGADDAKGKPKAPQAASVPPASAQKTRPPASNRGVRKTNTSTKTRLSSSVSPMKTEKKGRGVDK